MRIAYKKYNEMIAAREEGVNHSVWQQRSARTR
jgi:hypothetical protein